MLSALLASMQDGLSIVDPQGVHLYVNDALCRLLGFTREELLGSKAPHPYWPPDQYDAINAAFERTLRAEVDSFELIFQRKDGSRVPVIVAPSILRDDSGAPIAFFATVKDISVHKRLEKSLLNSEQRWRSIAENPFDFVVLIGRDYRYTYVNHTAPGIKEEDLIGRATPFDFVDPNYHDEMRVAFDTTFATGRATNYEVYVPRLDKWYSTIVGAVIEDGQVAQASILTREITTQKRVEETLRRSEQLVRETHRMETIGTLAGGMAHDINNMLTPILAAAELARRELPKDHVGQQRLKTIVDASQRARGLVQRVLLFSRHQVPKKIRFDWRQSVLDDLMLLRSSLPSSIKLDTHLPDAAIHVFGDPAQIGQVLTNLAANALQAMRDQEGTLTITLAQDRSDPANALLTVTDTGPGMDDNTLRRVFEPFFTTKPVGSGTGLGLSIVQSVIREHGGEVTAHSEPGKGATFSVRLPVCDADEASAERPATPLSQSPSLRVLVVDDEEAIVAVAQAALARSGHKVTCVTSARDALAILTANANAFDALVTDQSMPDMKGTQLIASLRAVRPDLPCVLMTGLSDEAVERQAKNLGVIEIIAKPFTLSVLCDAVARTGSRRL